MRRDIETSVGTAAIERAMAVFEQMKDLSNSGAVQARKALTDHIFGQISGGELDEHRLVVSGLTRLKALQRSVGFLR